MVWGDKELKDISKKDDKILDKLTSSPQATQSSVKKDFLNQPFVFEEGVAGDKLVFTIFGKKGTGKTTAAFSFPGKIFCLSFDRKSAIIKREFYNDDERITVFDVMRKYKVDANDLSSALLVEEDARNALKYVAEKGGTDWVVIDNIEILNSLAEKIMRFNNNLGVSKQFANLNLWKERNAVINALHNMALTACKKGVIYTTYPKNVVEKMENGINIEQIVVPNYVGDILYETDVVLKTGIKFTKEGAKNILVVESSKVRKIKTGTEFDVTDKQGVAMLGIVG